ncbi:MAG: restriction endonuclease [Methylotenera sp.]|nr:restriction endonuclease [Methylotenera sp.]
MARRKNDSLLDVLLELAASLSWKTSALIAIFSFLIFHYVSGLPLEQTKDIHSFNQNLYKNLFITFSGFLQYVFPMIFLAGALVSAIKGKRRRKLLDKQSSIQSIRTLSWQEFELLVAEAFSRKGFKVLENGGGGPDGGIDLILQKDGKKSIVQCKRWRTVSIGVTHIRELYGVMTGVQANDCIFVSSGNYTAEARLFAEEKPIWLIDSTELIELVGTVQVEPRFSPTIPNVQTKLATPTCPICSSVMIKRTARKGNNVGNEFWGCSTFPRCKGTVQI